LNASAYLEAVSVHDGSASYRSESVAQQRNNRDFLLLSGLDGTLSSRRKRMANRGDYRRRDFDESEHPRDTRGRFVDDEDDNNDGRNSFRSYGREGYGQRGGQHGGGGYGVSGRHGTGGLTRGGAWTEQDYGGSEGGFGYPSEGQRSQGRWGGRSGTGEYEDYRRDSGGSGYRYDQGGGYSQSGRNDDDEGQSDYHHWRGEQIKKFDQDYDEWRSERRKKFSEDFDKWRSSRSSMQSQDDKTIKK
jgi:hypothetical protein